MNLNELFGEDLVLENERVLLRPRKESDFDAFKAIAFEEKIWDWYPALIKDETDLRKHFDTMQNNFNNKTQLTFSIFDKAANLRLAGSTSFMNISFFDKRLEIGWTWLHPDFWKTGLNRACKKLLLQYAFDTLGFERVELKTDALNEKSVIAMEKIGATREGVLRNRRQMFGGRRRDTVYYSILKSEWPDIKKHIFKITDS